jgi:hypothetical protein
MTKSTNTLWCAFKIRSLFKHAILEINYIFLVQKIHYVAAILSYIAERGCYKAVQISILATISKQTTILDAFPQNNYCKIYFLILSVNKLSGII